MLYIDSEKTIIKSWCNYPEAGAIEQMKNLANLPFIFRQACLMPDGHQGYGMPIGGVIATKNVIIPNAVGLDIGCGMLAVKTSLASITRDDLIKVKQAIQKSVPVGFKHHSEKRSADWVPEPIGCTVNEVQYENSKFQVGTLGGGNHFIEIQEGDDGHIWFMIHSGSRNVGLKVAQHYDKIAKNLNELWFTSVPKSSDLAFLPIETKEAKDYMAEMNWCLAFSYMNRQHMAEVIFNIMKDITGCSKRDEINIHHNYARFENHYRQDVMVHRKGATSAKLGERGIIPGNQGTKSYIVEGLGNPESFESCSHGAGRKLGRKDAKAKLSLEDEIRDLNSKGILHSVRYNKDLEEAPGAYKDIDVVMKEQEDLVKILVTLKPLAVVKG